MTADIISADDETIGKAVLRSGPHGLIIRIEAEGISEGYHGAHLHLVGDCSDPGDGFKRAAGHINPTGDEHGLLNPKGYHVGSNFPNVHAGPEGLKTEVFANDLLLEEAMDEDGFSLIIHENEDDHMSQPIGGAGGRIACAAFN